MATGRRVRTGTRCFVVVASAALAVNLALLSGAILGSPTVALAAECPLEQVIFVKASGVVTGKGNVQNIKTRTQAIDQTCIAQAEMHATTHVVDTSFFRFAEVGWTVWQSTGGGGTRFCQLFWESFDGVAYSGGPGSGPLVPCDTYMSWKLWVQPASTRWKFWYDPELDGTYVQVGPLYGSDTGFSAGIPEGETGRRGDATGAYDHHSSMKYNTVGGNTGWQSWAGISLDYDTMPGYHYHVIDPAQYEVVAD